MSPAKILWVDDEIESLQSQKLFLENKGYEVHTLTNGYDAVEYVKENAVDVVLMDESMPGLTGLQTLARIKEVSAQIPVVLITKNETENLMDDAIGNEISDYLIKPVNPNQVWLSLKKIIDNRRLVAKKPQPPTNNSLESCLWPLTTIPTTTNGWIFIKNWCIGNWKWKKVTVLKCRKSCTAKSRRQTLSFLNL
jgi:DNA-binding NtrC family response regulator